MDRNNKGILIGMALGDGSIKQSYDKRYNKVYYSIQFTHSFNQYDYLNYKAKLLHSIFGGNKPKLTVRDNNGKNYAIQHDKIYKAVVCSKGNKYFNVIRSLLYPNGKKYITVDVLNYLTPHGIAIWWMDDGSLYMQRRNGNIHAREGILSTYISLEENITIASFFKEKYDITFIPVKSKNSYRLRINTTNLKKFLPIIEPYIIPSMLYKIDMKY